jgi:hypothetical protein
MAEAPHPDAALSHDYRELITCGVEHGSPSSQHPVVRLEPGADAPRESSAQRPKDRPSCRQTIDARVSGDQCEPIVDLRGISEEAAATGGPEQATI